MRRLMVFALLAIMTVAVASAVSADSNWRGGSGSFRADVSERGWGIPISFGTEKEAAEYMVVFVNCFGRILTPCDGVLSIPENSGVVTGYIIPRDVTKVNQYEMRWDLSVISDWDRMHVAEFDSAIGWRFTITPDEYCGRGPLRTLSLAIKEFNAKHWYVRAIFKFTYAKGSVKNYDRIILSVVPASPVESSVSAGPSAEMATFVAEVNKRFEMTAAYVSKLENRVTELENYHSKYPAHQTAAVRPAVPASAEVEFDLCVITSCQGSLRVEVGGKTYHGGSLRLCLPCGTYQARVYVGDRASDWVTFRVFPGMGRVNITVN